MADYDIQIDFSRLDTKGRITQEDERRAAAMGERYLASRGIDTLATTGNTRLTARIAPGLMTNTSEVHISPAEGQAITNIDEMMRVLRATSGVMIHASEPETVRFTRQYGDRQVYFCIRTRTPKRDEETVRVEVGGLDDAPFTASARPSHKETVRSFPAIEFRGIRYTDAIASARAPLTPLEAIAQYAMIGERVGAELGKSYNPDLARGLVNKLQDSIMGIATSDGQRPLVAYSAQDRLIKTDVFPQRGATITRIDLGKNAVLYDTQRRGIITYRAGTARISVHRRNLYEKFDIRGPLEQSKEGEAIITPPPMTDYQAVMQFLTRLPITLMADDDTELTTVYQSRHHPNRVFLVPLRGAGATVAGVEEAIENDGNIRRFMRRKSGPVEIQFPDKVGENAGSVIVVPAPSQYSAKWHEMGGMTEDVFDRFYKQHQAQQGKGQ